MLEAIEKIKATALNKQNKKILTNNTKRNSMQFFVCRIKCEIFIFDNKSPDFIIRGSVLYI